MLVCSKTTSKRYSSNFPYTCVRSGLGIIGLYPVKKVNVVIAHSALEMLLVSPCYVVTDTEHIRGNCPGKVTASGSAVIQALLTGQERPNKLWSVHEKCILLAQILES